MPRRETIRNAVVVLVSGAIALALAEALVRLFVTVRDIGPVFSTHDPVFGKRIKSNLDAERLTPEFRMRLTTNSLGFRGPEPARYPHRPILFLGDSFTLGYGVSDGEEYPALVWKELRRRHGDAAPAAVNAGIGNSGNGFWVKMLQGEALKMQPRLIVMQVAENDFADNLNDALYALDAKGSLRELPVPGPGIMQRLEALISAVPGLSYSHLIGLLRTVRLPKSHGPPSQPQLGGTDQAVGADHLTLRILDHALGVCEQRGWNVVGMLVGLPAAREAAVEGLFAKRKFVIVRIPPRSERPDLYYKIDGHWHAHGHQFVARRLLEALEPLKLEASDTPPLPKGAGRAPEAI
jgi:hypothetical protein